MTSHIRQCVKHPLLWYDYLLDVQNLHTVYSRHCIKFQTVFGNVVDSALDKGCHSFTAIAIICNAQPAMYVEAENREKIDVQRRIPTLIGKGCK